MKEWHLSKNLGVYMLTTNVKDIPHSHYHKVDEFKNRFTYIMHPQLMRKFGMIDRLWFTLVLKFIVGKRHTFPFHFPTMQRTANGQVIELISSPNIS